MMIDVRSRRAERGFTLLEVLIATALTAAVMIGVLPLFVRSMTNNIEGGQLTEVTTLARQHMEELMTLPMEAPALTVPVGETELVTTEMWSGIAERWIDEDDFPSDEPQLFTRVTRVRQFSTAAFDPFDLALEDSEALAGGTILSQVHFKEILVRVNSGTPTLINVLGRQKAITLRTLKSV